MTDELLNLLDTTHASPTALLSETPETFQVKLLSSNKKTGNFNRIITDSTASTSSIITDIASEIEMNLDSPNDTNNNDFFEPLNYHKSTSISGIFIPTDQSTGNNYSLCHNSLILILNMINLK